MHLSARLTAKIRPPRNDFGYELGTKPTPEDCATLKIE
jgi:hypothetical protein